MIARSTVHSVARNSVCVCMRVCVCVCVRARAFRMGVVVRGRSRVHVCTHVCNTEGVGL